MLLASLLGLIIPIVTVASYSPTTLDREGAQKLSGSVESKLQGGRDYPGIRIVDHGKNYGIKTGDRILSGFGNVKEKVLGSQVDSANFPISPPTCIACDSLGGSENGWRKSGGEELEEHRCPEWASAPPVLDGHGDGDQSHPS